MQHKSFLLLMVLLAPLSQAAVYKWIDGNGEVHYSDQPPTENAKPVELPKAMFYTPPKRPVPKQAKGEDEQQPPFAGYKALAILSPENNGTVRSNTGEVAVTIDLDPALQKGHKLQVQLDGQTVSDDATSTALTLQQVERGTHSLKVAVIDANGRALKQSQSVRFTLRKESLIGKKKADAPDSDLGGAKSTSDSFKPGAAVDYTPGPSTGGSAFQPSFTPKYQP